MSDCISQSHNTVDRIPLFIVQGILKILLPVLVEATQQLLDANDLRVREGLRLLLYERCSVGAPFCCACSRTSATTARSI